METLSKSLASVQFAPNTAHHKKRASDGQFEIVVKAKIDDDWRFVAIDVRPNRVKAVEAVRFIRAKGKK